MKRTLLSIIAFTFCLCAGAQWDREVFERTYISTDRQVYLAGDRVWCSAFCFDARSGNLSDASAVAYLELVAADDIAATAKISLFGGRGGGYIDLPSTLASGNYALVAFTAQNKNEKDYDFSSSSKIISVYNLSQKAKVPGGVEYAPVSVESHSRLEKSGNIVLDVPVSAPRMSNVALTVSSPDKASSMSVSIARRNHLPVYGESGISAFRVKAAADAAYEHNVLPEYDGEVVYASVEGPDMEDVLKNGNTTGYLSSIGEKNDTYTAQMAPDGSLIFRTYNIFGGKDLLSQVNADDNVDAHIILDSPFVPLQGLDIPLMKIDESLKVSLEAMEPGSHRGELLPRVENPAFITEDAKVYRLDDYTRFPTMKEVFVEIVPEVRSRGKGDRFRFEILIKDNNDQPVNRWLQSLVMMDGVPVFQHQKLQSFDAYKIDRIEIWRKQYCIGDRVYTGVVNLVTKDGGVEYINFGSNVRIVSFTGVSYPMSYTTRPEGGPDNRETIFWHPLLRLDEGESVTLECLTPERPGLYDVTVEGVTESGERFVQQSILRVE